MSSSKNKVTLKEMLTKFHMRVALGLLILPIFVMNVLYWFDVVSVLAMWVSPILSLIVSVVYLFVYKDAIAESLGVLSRKETHLK